MPVKKRPAAPARIKKPAKSEAPTKDEAPAKRRIEETRQRTVTVKRRPASVEIVVTRSKRIVLPRIPASVEAPRRGTSADSAPPQPIENDGVASEKSAPVSHGVFVKNNPNESSGPPQASFNSERFAEGNFRNVFKGSYTGGARTGEACVMKEFKSGCVYEKAFFENDIKAVKKAGEIIEAFNELGLVSKKIYLNEPEVWTGLRGRITSQMILVESFIRGEFIKFNSNSGYVKDDSDTMQALSHFSFHHTQGQFLLCDLQGGRSAGYYVLTDPVILSKSRMFGVTDLGQKGIDNFMAYHQCGRFCNPNWRMPKPDSLVPLFKAVSGTTFGDPEQLFGIEQVKNLQNKIKKCWIEHLPS
jgi:hypothetical protein